MADWVLAVERAYVAAAVAPTRADASRADLGRARAAAAAVASHFLAVGSPRSMSFVFDDIAAALLVLAAHRTWFAPVDLRCAGAGELADKIGGRVVSLEEAFAADIVNIQAADWRITAAHVRRGTHVNVLGPAFVVADDLRAIATVADEPHDLPALAAGLRDGRQRDEISIFIAGDAAIASAALAQRP